MSEAQDALDWRRGRPWQLLERERELALLSEALESAAGGQGRLLFLVGEAGIGKTALLRLFSATHPEFRTLTGACEPLDTPEALAPLFDIASGLGADVQESLARGTGRAQLFASVASALRGAARPRLIVFEDVHWADQATLDLLRYLGRRTDGLAAVIVATFREEEAAPGSPLSVALGDLATAPGVQRITLEPLSERATGLLAARTGTDPGELHRRTGGNPFFITEILAAGGEHLPVSVRDAVLARLARLAEPTRLAIEAASAIGPRFDTNLLASVLDATSLPRWTMRAAVFTGFLRQERDELAFRHVLAQSAISESLAPERLEHLHRVILKNLQLNAPGPETYASLVFHAEYAGDDAVVARFAPLAADRAAALDAHREAAALYGAALARAAGEHADRRAALMELRAEQLNLAGDLEPARAAYESSAVLWREAGDLLGEGGALAQVASLSFLRGQHEAAALIEAEALGILEALRPSRELAMTYERRGRRLFMALQPLEGALWASKSLTVAEQLGDTEVGLEARVCWAAARLMSADERGRDKLIECLQAAVATGKAELAARTAFYLGWLPLLHRNYAGLEPYLDSGLALAEEHELEYWRLLSLATRARFCLDQGRWNEAEQCAKSILDQANPAPVARLPALATIGRLRARRGETDTFHYLDQSSVLAQAHKNLEAVSAALPARAEAAWLTGDWEAARLEAESALAGGIGIHNPWWAGELRCWLRRAGGATPESSEAVAEPYALELAGDWAAAAAWWERRGCRYEAALALSLGDSPDALTGALATFESLGAQPAAAWTRSRLRGLGVAAIPRGPRPSTSANPARLTRREQDVLSLVADGLTNAQIGSRLYLSHKTVERHLSSVLSKLEASSRTEAVGHARALGALRAPQHEGSPAPI